MNILKAFKFIAVALTCGLCVGCASVTGSSTQNIRVETKTKEGEPLCDADCTLKNDKGSWQTKSPHGVDVRKSSKDLKIVCNKQGHEQGETTVASSVNGGMFGNILIGGGIGAIIDHSKGTAYDYPNTIPVEMGNTLNLGKKTKQHMAKKAEEKNGKKKS